MVEIRSMSDVLCMVRMVINMGGYWVKRCGKVR
jgi:hypothetical protein